MNRKTIMAFVLAAVGAGVLFALLTTPSKTSPQPASATAPTTAPGTIRTNGRPIFIDFSSST